MIIGDESQKVSPSGPWLEFEANHYASISMPNGKDTIYLPQPHYYEVGYDMVKSFIVDGVDLTGEKGSAWWEETRSPNWCVDSSTATWSRQIVREDTSAAAIVEIAWVQRLIDVVPEGMRCIVATGDPATADRTADWRELTHNTGTCNAILLPELPPGYQCEIWRKRKSKKKLLKSRKAGNWLAYQRLAEGTRIYTTYVTAAQTAPTTSSAAFRVAYFNSITGARSHLSSQLFIKNYKEGYLKSR